RRVRLPPLAGARRGHLGAALREAAPYALPPALLGRARSARRAGTQAPPRQGAGGEIRRKPPAPAPRARAAGVESRPAELRRGARRPCDRCQPAADALVRVRIRERAAPAADLSAHPRGPGRRRVAVPISR